MIILRPTVRGEPRYFVRLRGPDGKVRSRTFRTKREARVYERAQQAALDVGSWVDPRRGKVLFSAYAEQWIENRTVRGRRLAPRTEEGYRYLLKRILPSFGPMALAKITPQDVRTWHAEVVKAGPATVAPKAYRLLHAILATAADDQLIAFNPCRVKGAAQERSAERRTITPAEVAHLADVIDQRWRALVLVAAYGGLRYGELVGLRRGDIDLKRGIVRVDSQLVETGTGIVRTPPKSDAGRRSVTLPKSVRDELRIHLAQWVDTGDDAPVFVGARGGTLRRRNWARIWSRARADAGLPAGFRLHDLRHSGATWATQAGATTREVMARFGHSTPRAALIYQHAAESRDRDLAEALDRLARRGGEAARVPLPMAD